MTNMERSQIIEIFEQATTKLETGQEVEWSSLVTKILQLPMRYALAVQVALAQGRWRNAKNPKAYIRQVARREALKMDSACEQTSALKIPDNVCDEDGGTLSYEEYIDHQSYDYGAVKEGGVWHARNPLDEAVWVDEQGRVLPVVNGRPIPEDLLIPEDDELDAKLMINFQKVAERAGLDAEETKILTLRGRGFTRADLLDRLARDDEERRSWQAAWRRLDRHMDTIRTIVGG